MKAVVIYIPVPHPGYMALLDRHQPDDIILLSSASIKLFCETIADQLSRDFHCLPVKDVATYLHLKYPAANIREFDGIDSLKHYESIVMPDEDVSHCLTEYLDKSKVTFDTAFLRYDWRSVNFPKEVVADYMISVTDFDREFMKAAIQESNKSSDFWRQVGAVIPLDNGFLAAFNEHMPTPMEPYIYGDMRLIMKPGEKPEICGALHAEKAVFAQALRQGISLEGRDIYVTTFPCRACAQMISKTGIKRVFFKDGYSNQDAAQILQAAGIVVVRVELN